MAENRNTNASTYNDDSIQTLAWNEHIRQRPGMYVGRFGDGSQSDDGMYVLIKEVMDNSIDEYMMGHGKTIEVTIEGRRVTIRDYGRGIPLNKLSDAVSKMNTGGKFEDSTSVPQVGRTERRRRKGGERPLQRIHRPQRARRPGPHGQLLARLRALGPLGGGGAGKKRSVGELRPRRRRKDIRQLRLQLRVRGTHVPPLYLSQSGADGEVQRQGLSFEERSARPAQRQPFRGAALPAHPPDGRGHRGSHHPRAAATAKPTTRS